MEHTIRKLKDTKSLVSFKSKLKNRNLQNLHCWIRLLRLKLSTQARNYSNFYTNDFINECCSFHWLDYIVFITCKIYFMCIHDK